MRWAAVLVLLLPWWSVGCTEDAPPARPLQPRAPDLGTPADIGPTFVIVPGAVVIEADPLPDAAAQPPKPTKPKPRRKVARKSAPPKVSSRGSARLVSAEGAIRAHWSEVEQCYGGVALKDPTVEGRIVLQWTLGADGWPTGTAVVKDTLSDKRVAACIKTRARKWRFPAPSGGVSVVTYPFDLRVR